MPSSRSTKSFRERSVRLVCAAIVAAAVCCAKPVWSAEFLTPLPIQDLYVGARYTLGIRPSRGMARRTLNSKIDLYADGLSRGASFRMVGDEIWELSWLPAAADSGVHSVRVLVTERGRPTEVLEVQELTFVVHSVLAANPTPAVAAVKPSTDTKTSATSLSESVVPNLASQPSSAFVAIDMDAPKADTLVIVPAADSALISESDGDTWSEFVEELDESNKLTDTPGWSLASIASRVVTPHQWVRFPVELVSDSGEVGEYVAVQVDTLPNGATFDENSEGTRQFQWRPGTADGGEHVFNFTAVDTTNSEARQTVTMRIIVQE